MKINFPPALAFTQRPTPLVRLKAPANYQLWMKRDDMTGVELSGNKIRKLDFLLQQAISEGADGIITCGGLQSNHCRTAAYLAQKVGLKAILFLRGEPEVPATGNYLLDRLSAAEIIHVSAEEYKQIEHLMQLKVREQNKRGFKYYIIPEGGSNEIGAWGYCQCFCEICDQMAETGITVDAIAVATGSGGTHAGLLLGKIMMESSIEIISFNVCDNADYFKKKITVILKKFAEKYNKSIPCREEDIHIYDGFVGGGYGKISENEVSFIRQFAREEGILLDPVYTAKAFFGLTKQMQSNQFQFRNVIFIHTGGIFGLFPYAAYFS
jgi:D-cysteine desulfhydrase